jgi:hypothetical protein
MCSDMQLEYLCNNNKAAATGSCRGLSSTLIRVIVRVQLPVVVEMVTIVFLLKLCQPSLFFPRLSNKSLE